MKAFENKDIFVIYETDLQYILKAYLVTRPNVISDKDLLDIENLLVCLNTNSDQNVLEHVQRLTKKFY